MPLNRNDLHHYHGRPFTLLHLRVVYCRSKQQSRIVVTVIFPVLSFFIWAGKHFHKGVSPEYLHKSGHGFRILPGRGHCGLKVEPGEQNEFKLD